MVICLLNLTNHFQDFILLLPFATGCGILTLSAIRGELSIFQIRIGDCKTRSACFVQLVEGARLITIALRNLSLRVRGRLEQTGVDRGDKLLVRFGQGS